MFEKDGITYADEQKPELTVLNVKPLYSGVLLVTFSTGEKRLFDTTLLTEPVYEPLKDSNVVNNPILFHGIITWLDGTIDISPEAVYQISYRYNTQDVISA